MNNLKDFCFSFLEKIRNKELPNNALIKQFEKNASFIAKNGKLPNPYEEETEFYIEEFCTDVIKIILSMRVDKENGKEWNSLINDLIQFFPRKMFDLDSTFSKMFISVFNSREMFYLTTKTYDYWEQKTISPFIQQNTNSLLKTNFLQILIDSYTSTTNVLSISKFIFTMDFIIKLKLDNKQINSVIEAAGIYFLKIANDLEEENIREIDETKLKKITIFLFSRLKKQREQLSDAEFKLGMRLAQSSFLNKQFFGLESLKNGIETSLKSDEFCKILADNNFVSTLLKNLHFQLVDNFSKIVKALATRNLLKEEEMEEFWNVTINQSSTTQDKFFDALSSIFSELPDNYKDIIWREASKLKSFPSTSFNFFIECSKFAKSEQLVPLFNAMDSIYSEAPEEDRRKLIKVLCALMPDDDEIMTKVQEKCLEHIKNKEELDYSLQLLKASALNIDGRRARTCLTTISNTVLYMEELTSINIFELFKVFLKAFDFQLLETEEEMIEKIILKYIEIDAKEIKSFVKSIKQLNKGLLTDDFCKKLFFKICEVKPSGKDPIDFILYLFEEMNKENYVDAPFSYEKTAKDATKFNGINELWSLCFETGSKDLQTFLCKLYTKSNEKSNISEFIDKCMANTEYSSALETLSRTVKEEENGEYKEYYGMEVTKFTTIDNSKKLHFVGDIKRDIDVKKGTLYSDVTKILSIIGQVPKQSISLYRNGTFLSYYNFSIEDEAVYKVKITKNNNEYKKPDFSLMPSVILTQNQDYFVSLIRILSSSDTKKANAALEILLEMPPYESEMSLLNSVRTDFEKMFDTDKTALLMYRINLIGKILKENKSKDWVSMFYAKCSIPLFHFILTKAKTTLEDNHKNLKIALKITKFAFINAPSDQMPYIIRTLGDSQIEDILQWIEEMIYSETQESYELIDSLLSILKFFAEFKQEAFFQTQTFIIIFNKLILHKKGTLRKAIMNIARVIDPSLMEETYFQNLSESTTKDCSELFELIQICVEKSEKKLKWLSLIETILYDKYDCKDDNSVLAQLNFISPPDIFTQNIFRILSTILEPGIISKDAFDTTKLFRFIISKILFNPLKYYNPTKCFFDVLLSLLKMDENLINEFIPYLDVLSQKITDNEKRNLKFSIDTKYRGLKNLGATCYMNSSLQQLFNIPEFRNEILKSPITDPDWAEAFQSLIAKLVYYPTKYINPKFFVNQFTWYGDKINPSEQQDAIEFIQMMIDKCDKVFPGVPKLFTGTISHEIVGTSAEFQSESLEPFVSFPIEVKGHKDLEQSLHTFLQPDIFTGSEQYNAEGIGKIDAKRYHKVLSAPQILILQLKRFEYDLSTGNRTKINSKYMFPMEFDLSKVMKEADKPVMYDLVGVTMHVGNANGGHYYTYAGNPNEEWNCFNDSSVTKFNKEKIPQVAFGNEKDSYGRSYESADNAYLLFYRKRSEDNESIPETVCDPTIVDKMSQDIKKSILVEVLNNKLYTEFVLNAANVINDTKIGFMCLLKSLAFSHDEKTMESTIVRMSSLCEKDSSVYPILFEHMKKELNNFLITNESKKCRESFAVLVENAIKETKDTEIYLSFVENCFKGDCTILKENPTKYESFLRPFSFLLQNDMVKDSKKWISSFISFISTKLFDGKTLNEKTELAKRIDLSSFFNVIYLLLEKDFGLWNEYGKQLLNIKFYEFLVEYPECAPNIINIWKLLTEKTADPFISSVTSTKKIQPHVFSIILIFAVIIKEKEKSLLSWCLKKSNKMDSKWRQTFLSSFVDEMQLVEFDFKPFIVTEVSFIIESWLFSDNPATRYNAIDIFEKTWTNKEDSNEVSEVKKILNALYSKFEKMISVTNDRCEDSNNTSKSPIKEFFSAIKWAIAFSNSYETITENSNAFVKTMNKCKALSLVGDSIILDVVELLNSMRDNIKKSNFFKNVSYSSFLKAFNTSNFISTSRKDVDELITLIINMTSMYNFNEFSSSGIFKDLCKHGLLQQSLSREKLASFFDHCMNSSCSKQVFKVLFNQEMFDYHSNMSSHYYFIVCNSFLGKFPEYSEKVITKNSDRLLGELKCDCKKDGFTPTKSSSAQIMLFSTLVMNIAASKAKNPKLYTELLSKIGEVKDLVPVLVKDGLLAKDNDVFCATCGLCESLIYCIPSFSSVLFDFMNKNKFDVSNSRKESVLSLIKLVSIIVPKDAESKLATCNAIFSQLKSAPMSAFCGYASSLMKIVEDGGVDENLCKEIKEFIIETIKDEINPDFFKRDFRTLMIQFIRNGEDPSLFAKLCMSMIPEAYGLTLLGSKDAIQNLRRYLEFLLILKHDFNQQIDTIGLDKEDIRTLIEFLGSSEDINATDIKTLLASIC